MTNPFKDYFGERRTTVLFILMGLVAYWVSGLRIQTLPGMTVRVVDSETGTPISQALVVYGYPWSSRLSGVVDQFAIDGKERLYGIDIREVSTGIDGMASDPLIYRAVWMWWKRYSRHPRVQEVLHPLYVLVAVKERPFSYVPFQMWPVPSEIQMRRLSSHCKDWASQQASSTRQVPFSSTQARPEDYLLLLVGSYFRKSRPTEEVLSFPAGFRCLTDFQMIRNEWIAAAEAMRTSAPHFRRAALSHLAAIQGGMK